MKTDFRLPVTAGEAVQVAYQRPEMYDQTPRRRRGDADAPFDLALRRPQKPVIVMLHGAPAGHKGGCDDIFTAAERHFEALGYPSLRFDFRGCGESDGAGEDFSMASALADLGAVLQWAQHDAGHRSIILMGEGFGAAVALRGLPGRNAAGLVMLWPVLPPDPEAFTEDLGRVAVPVLIQHGTQDAQSPLAHAYFARDHVRGPSDLCVFEGGDHGLCGENLRRHLFLNLRYYLERVYKKLDSAAKT